MGGLTVSVFPTVAKSSPSFQEPLPKTRFVMVVLMVAVLPPKMATKPLSTAKAVVVPLSVPPAVNSSELLVTLFASVTVPPKAFS